MTAAPKLGGAGHSHDYTQRVDQAFAAARELAAYTDESSEGDVGQFIASRAHRATALTQMQAEQYERYRQAEEVYTQAKESHKQGLAPWAQVREAADNARDEYDLWEMLNTQVSEYAAGTARQIAAREKAGQVSVPRFDGDGIDGHLVPVERGAGGALGVGGSDIATIMGLRSSSPYQARKQRETLVAIKAGLESREPLDLEDYSLPAARGVAWETTILSTASSRRTDGLTAARPSAVWRSTQWGWAVTAIDGVWVDDAGIPVGIIEAKYSTNPSQWGESDEGLDGVPAAARAQAIWYAYLSGLHRGTVAVLLNDSDVRTYDFELDGAMLAEAESMMQQAQEFWDEVEQARADGQVNRAPSRRISISADALRPGWGRSRDTFLDNVCAFRDQSRQEVIAAYNTILGGRDEKDMTTEERRAALKRLYTDFDLSKRRRPVVMVDLEATGVIPHTSHIIETGASIGRAIRGADGSLRFEESDAIDSLHGLNKVARAGRGTGPEDVHGISVDMVAGKPDFASSEAAGALLDALLESGTLWAHNAAYEDSMLRHHLPGYAEARDRGHIKVMDTMVMSRHLDGEKEGVSHSLKSVVTRHGGEYVNAHRAKSDADMQVRGVLGMLSVEH